MHKDYNITVEAGAAATGTLKQTMTMPQSPMASIYEEAGKSQDKTLEILGQLEDILNTLVGDVPVQEGVPVNPELVGWISNMQTRNETINHNLDSIRVRVEMLRDIIRA